MDCMSLHEQLNDFWALWSHVIKYSCGPLCPELHNLDFLLGTVSSTWKTPHSVNTYNFIVRVSKKSKWFKSKRHRIFILFSERVCPQIRYFSLALKGISSGTCLSILNVNVGSSQKIQYESIIPCFPRLTVSTQMYCFSQGFKKD